jgi:hypothetical protein
MVDQGAEVSSLAIADFDDRGRKIEQYPFKPFSITLARISAYGLQKGIPGEADLAAGSVDPRKMQAMLPDIEVGLTQARTIEDNGQSIDRLELRPFKELARAFANRPEQR